MSRKQPALTVSQIAEALRALPEEGKREFAELYTQDWSMQPGFCCLTVPVVNDLLRTIKEQEQRLSRKQSKSAQLDADALRLKEEGVLQDKQIAKQLGIDIQNLRQRLHRAKKARTLEFQPELRAPPSMTPHLS